MSQRATVYRVWALLVLIALASCQPRTVVVEQEVTRIVTREQIVEQTVQVIQEVTRVVIKKETVQVEVTPTLTPVAQGGTLQLVSAADAEVLNPLFAADSASGEVISLLWDGAFEIDPWSGETIPGLVERWEIADGNRTITYHVRQGALWSDGEPITARDWKFMFDALLAKDSSGNPILADSSHLDLVKDVQSVDLVDEYTLRVTYAQPLCSNLDVMNLRWLPAHVYLQDPKFEWADLAQDGRNWAPTVFSGPFVFQEWVPEDHIALGRNPNYWKGAPYLDGVSWHVVSDPSEELEWLIAGRADVGGVDPAHLRDVEQTGNLGVWKFFSTVYDYLVFQQGDPKQPQPRLNADGTLNEKHGQHPILGKKEVRQALAYAIDRSLIINRVRMGQAAPMNAEIEPVYAWAYNEALDPRPYDPQKAAEMLDAAGWVLDAQSGLRTCQGCGTTADGTPMVLNLKTNDGDDMRQDIGVIIRDQLGAIGVQVDFQVLKWDAFLDALLSQTFDMAISGWRGGSEDKEVLFGAAYDTPNAGFNFGSVYLPDYEALADRARTVDGCAYAARGELYRQMQAIMYDEQPYVWLYDIRRVVAVNQRIGNVAPAPWSTMYNIHQWYIR
jgi:peptide/nickel transport system substrate-binding protein